MKPATVFALAALALTVAKGASAQNANEVLPGIAVGQGWTRISTEAGLSTPAYFTISNHGLTPDTLVSASCPVAHRTVLLDHAGGNANAIQIKPGQTITLTPHGQHLMLVQNRFRFYAHAMIPCSVEFLSAGKLILYLHVEPDSAKSFTPSRRSPIRN